MKGFSTEFKVGAFTLVGMLALGYMLVLLNYELFRSKKTQSYYTLTPNAKGVVSLTTVRTNGVTVGQVTETSLEGDHTKITFALDGELNVPMGSRIELRIRGLLGEVFLELIRAPDEGIYVPDGGMIPMNRQLIDYSDLIGVMGSIAEDVESITSSLSQLLVGHGEGNDGSPLQKMIIDMQESLSGFREMMEVNGPRLEKTIEHSMQISEYLSGVTREQDPLADLGVMTESFSSVMTQMRETVEDVQDIVQGVKEGQGTVGQLFTDQGLVDDLRGTANDVRELLSPAKKLQVRVQVRGEARTDSSFQTYLSTRWQFRPERYYVLGVSSLPYDQISTTTVTRESEGVEPGDVMVVKEVQRVERPAIRFDGQIGHRFGDLSLRFGLFESSGGFGANYDFFKGRLRMSLEAFKWREDSQIRSLAQWKAYGLWYIFPFLHVNFGLADITRRSSSLNLGKSNGVGDVLDGMLGNIVSPMTPFLGGGFHFDDEDLQKLLGAASAAF